MALLKKPLAIDLIRTDANTQSREGISEETVTEYAKVLEEGDWLFPDLIVFYDGSEYYLADGFQRRLAALRVGRGSVPCVIHEGTAIDARVFANSANLKHGDRCTQADKRRNAEWAVVTFPDATQKELADKAGCSTWLIKEVLSSQNDGSLRGNTPLPGVLGLRNPTIPISGEELINDIPNSHRNPPGDVVPDYGKCPNCLGTQWVEDDNGVSCAKCHHPHGEPAGDVDEKRISIQRKKTVKTVEALMRAFDDLQTLKPLARHEQAMAGCKSLLAIARGWR